MPDFEFDLGEIVAIDPTGEERGPKGKIVSQVLSIDGSRGYMVSAASLGEGTVRRHLVAEHEIHRVNGN